MGIFYENFFILQVLEFVRVAISSRKVNLLHVDLETSSSLNLDLPVDYHLDEITVSVSGNNSEIFLIGPDGKYANDTHRIKNASGNNYNIILFIM